MATDEMVRTFIELCNFEMLQQVVPGNVDWNRNLLECELPPLFLAVVNNVCDRTPAQQQTRLQMISWMVRSGADPLHKVSSSIVKTFSAAGEQAFKVSCNGHSAISICCAFLRLLQQQDDGESWSAAIKCVEEMLTTLSRAPMRRPQLVSVRQGVVNLWESIRDMDSTYDVIFEAADGEVAAHDLILMASSPVLRAMLESAMKEGANRRIRVGDSSSSGVTLFVDML